MSMMSGKKGMRKYSRGSKMSFAVFGPLENGWILSISCDYREVLARTSEMQVILTFIALIGLFLIFISCYTIIRKLTRPLIQFSESAKQIATGDFNTELPVIKSDDEIKQLRDSFDDMQRSLNAYIEDLKNSMAVNERFSSELNVASRIQMAMLPKNFPEHESFDLCALLKPAKEVGGDLYDFLLKDDLLYFAVGDVSGKGVPASMFMAITRSAFHFLVNMGVELDELTSRLNDAICEGNNTGMFVTMFAGCVNLKTGEFKYCNAGHNPTVLNGEFLDVKPNIALGLFPGFKYQMQKATVESGSHIILYTDGVTEAERADKQQFGDAALLEWARTHSGLSTQKEACQNLLDTVHIFTEENEQNDDITIMTLKIK